MGVKYLFPFVEKDTKTILFILDSGKKWVEEDLQKWPLNSGFNI